MFTKIGIVEGDRYKEQEKEIISEELEIIKTSRMSAVVNHEFF